jgi:hypothetical protein
MRLLLATVLGAELARAHSTALGTGPATHRAQASFFVSPGGDDFSAGSAALPFATLERALAGVRAEPARLGATITLLDGIYPLRAPVRVTDAHADAARPLTLRAAGVGAVLSGGVAITGWRWDNSAGLWRAPIPPEFNGSAALRQLFVGGQRLLRTAAPPRGALNVTMAADLAAHSPAQPANQSKLVGYVTTDLSVRDWAPGQVEGVYNGTAQEWCEHRCGVARTAAINATATLIVMQQPCFEVGMRRSGWSEATPAAKGLGVPNYWENIHGALVAGRWCLNTTARTVDVKPAVLGEAGDPSVLGAVAPLLETLLHVAGTSHVSVVGLGLEHAAWHLGSKGYISSQAGTWTGPYPSASTAGQGFSMMPSALLVTNGSEIVVEHCRVRRLGGAGITIAGGSKHSTVRSNLLEDISGSAVQLGGTVANTSGRCICNPVHLQRCTCRGMVVDESEPAQIGLSCINNTVRNLPREYHDAVGILGLYMSHGVIAHNTLENLSYSGINLGWGWGGDAPGVGHNTVANNSIKNYCLQLDDCGAIYTLSALPNSTIERNWLQQAPVLGCFGELPKCSNNQGIYHDAGSAFLVDTKNVIERGDCWLSLCGWSPDGCGIRNMSVHGNFIPTAEAKRLDPVCCCHGENINGHSSGAAGTSVAPFVVAANIEVQGATPVWPAEAVAIMKNAGVRP